MSNEFDQINTEFEEGKLLVAALTELQGINFAEKHLIKF
jgi:hypothetical protein